MEGRAATVGPPSVEHEAKQASQRRAESHRPARNTAAAHSAASPHPSTSLATYLANVGHGLHALADDLQVDPADLLLHRHRRRRRLSPRRPHRCHRRRHRRPQRATPREGRTERARRARRIASGAHGDLQGHTRGHGGGWPEGDRQGIRGKESRSAAEGPPRRREERWVTVSRATRPIGEGRSSAEPRRG